MICTENLGSGKFSSEIFQKVG